MAPAGQFMLQAPHSMQASRSVMSAFFFSMANTPWGHTCVQVPHPVQRAGSRRNVEMFFR